jgi:hypothetical protein
MKAKPRGIIVLEGPDGGGKTTLAATFGELYGARVLHATRYLPHRMWLRHVAYLRYACKLAQDRLVVLDRGWISECVYGATFRGGARFPHSARALDRVLLRHAAIHVMCLPRDLEVVVQNHARRAAGGGELFKTVREVAVRYEDLWSGSVVRPVTGDYVEQLSARGGVAQRGDWFRYDYTRDDREQFARSMIRELRVQREPCDDQDPRLLDHAYPNLVGCHQSARLLLVGEELGDRGRSGMPWPFCANDQSPEYLNRALSRIGFDETEAIWTNARTPDQWLPRLRTWSARYRPELVPVALGRVAERYLKNAGFEGIRHVRHPQHARRFDHHGQYHEELREVLT